MPVKKTSRAKSKALKETIKDSEIDITPAEAEEAPMGRTITVRKTILSEPLTPADIEALESDDAPDDNALAAFDESADFSDGYSSDLLNFFDEDGGDGGHKLRVFQIMQPGRGVKFTRGGTIYRGELPYTAAFLNDVQEQYGGGVFRLQVIGTWNDERTGRSRVGIIKAKTVTIAAPPKLVMPDDPTQPSPTPYMGGAPNVPYLLNPPPDQTPPATMKENLSELVAVVNMVDKLRGPQAPAQAQALDPEVAALTLIAKNPEIMSKLGDGLARTVLGDKALSNENPWASLLSDIVKSGQGPEIIGAVVRELLTPIRQLFAPAMPANGHAPQQPMPPQIEGQQGQQQPMPAHAPAQDPQQHSMPAQAEQPDPNTLPEDQALALLLQFCARGVPAAFACDRLLGYADTINDQAPQYSIDGYIDAFAEMSIDAALEFVKTQPGGDRVVALPHARAWTEELQARIKQQSQGEINR